MRYVGPATTQNLVVKFDGEICGGVLVENALTILPSKRSSKISSQTSPEVRHQLRRKLRQLHSGNRWCLGTTRYFLHSFPSYGPLVVQSYWSPSIGVAPWHALLACLNHGLRATRDTDRASRPPLHELEEGRRPPHPHTFNKNY